MSEKDDIERVKKVQEALLGSEMRGYTLILNSRQVKESVEDYVKNYIAKGPVKCVVNDVDQYGRVQVVVTPEKT